MRIHANVFELLLRVNTGGRYNPNRHVDGDEHRGGADCA